MTLPRRAAILAPFLAVACSLGIVFAQTAQAAWPGSNGRIVFFKADVVTMAAQIYSMNSLGQDQRNLSAAGGTSQIDIQPSVSPNGKRIAFTRGEFISPTTITAQLWTMNIDGTDQTDISNDAALASESGPSWTEGGSKILFVRASAGSFPGAGGSIWIRKANGKGTPRQLTAGPADANPAMSPDGDLLAFSRPVGGARHVIVMKADGSEAPMDIGQGSKPDWSPDSTRIAYGQAGFGTITIVSISKPANKLVVPGPFNEAPAWSPDGTQIAFMDCAGFPICQIALMSATGQNQHDITADPSSSDQKPSWQPIPREDQETGS